MNDKATEKVAGRCSTIKGDTQCRRDVHSGGPHEFDHTQPAVHEFVPTQLYKDSPCAWANHSDAIGDARYMCGLPASAPVHRTLPDEQPSVMDWVAGGTKGYDIRHREATCSEFLCLPEVNPSHYEVIPEQPCWLCDYETERGNKRNQTMLLCVVAAMPQPEAALCDKHRAAWAVTKQTYERAIR